MSVERDRPDWRPPWTLPSAIGNVQPVRAADPAASSAFARSLQRVGQNDPSIVEGKPGERAGTRRSGEDEVSARDRRSTQDGTRGEPVRDRAADERRGNARFEARRSGHEQAGRERAVLENGRDRDTGSRSASSRRAPVDDVSADGNGHDRSCSESVAETAMPRTVASKGESGSGDSGEHRPAPRPDRTPLPVSPVVLSPSPQPVSVSTVVAGVAACAPDASSFVPAQATSTLARLLARLVHPPAAADAPWRLQLETRDASLGVVHLEHRAESGWHIAVQPRDPEARRATSEQLAELGAALRERGHRVASIEQLPMDDTDR